MATEVAILQGICFGGFAATSGAAGRLGERPLVLFGPRTAGLPGMGQDGEGLPQAAALLPR